MNADLSMVFALMAAFGGYYLTQDGALRWTRAFDLALLVTGVVGLIVLRVRRSQAQTRDGATAPGSKPPTGPAPSP